MIILLRAVLLFVACFSLFKSYRFQGYTDFDVYYQYGLKILSYWKGLNPSFAVDPANTSPFRYAPIVGVLFVPFSLLPHDLARACWVFVGWVCYFVSLEKIKKHFKLSTLEYFVVALGTIRFARDNASIGQISNLNLLLLTCVFIYFAQKKSAIALALSTIVKVQPFGLILVPIFQRKWKYIATVLLGIVALVAASWICVGTEAMQSWFSLFLSAHDVLSPKTIGNQSIYGALIRHTDHPMMYMSFFVAVAGLVSFFYWKKEKWNPLWGFSVALAFLPVLGILTWKNTYTLWMIPFAFFIRYHSLWVVFPVAVLFQLLSRGIIGREFNGISLGYGILPFVAYFSVLFWMVYKPKNATTATRPANKLQR